MNLLTKIQKMADDGMVSDSEVLSLREAIFGNDYRVDRIDQAEAEALFKLNDIADGKCNAWPQFFIEAICDYCVHQEKPSGYVSEENASWLIAMISASGKVKTATELELLVRVMEVARQIPVSLERFAVDQVRAAVLDGDGIAGCGRTLRPGQIGEVEVDLLRRILYASAGTDGTAISKAEADMLFDMNDAVTSTDNHPSWRELFVNAIANYLMAARVRTAPGREEMLRREEWLDKEPAGVVGMLFGAMSSGLRGMVDGNWKDTTTNAEALAVERHNKLVADTATSEVITEDEALWLVDRINRDGDLHEAENALLAFIKAEAPEVHPVLQPLLDRVA